MFKDQKHFSLRLHNNSILKKQSKRRQPQNLCDQKIWSDIDCQEMLADTKIEG